MTKFHFEREMKRGVDLAGIEKIRIHGLRHSHASLLISKMNVPVVAVSRRLGHVNIKTTMDVYSHLYPDQMDTIATQLNREMSNGGNVIAW